MGKLSNRSISRLEGVRPLMVKIFVEGCPTSPFDYGIPGTGGLRTDEQQKKEYAKGRTTAELIKKGINGVEGQPGRTKVTWTLNSKHKAKEDGFGHAVDIYAYVNGKPTWEMKYIKPIAEHLKKFALEKYGITLYWGFDLWGKDGAHFQDSKD